MILNSIIIDIYEYHHVKPDCAKLWIFSSFIHNPQSTTPAGQNFRQREGQIPVYLDVRFIHLNLSALPTTVTSDIAIAPAEISGLSSPNAASGIASTL